MNLTCMFYLGQWEAASQEADRLKELLRDNPALTKRKDLQEAIFGMKFATAVMIQDEKKAQAYLELHFDQMQSDGHYLEIMLWGAEYFERNGMEERAQELYDYLLRFSSENSAVRKAMAYGTYTHEAPKELEKQKISDVLVSGLLIMASVVFIVLILVVCLW